MNSTSAKEAETTCLDQERSPCPSPTSVADSVSTGEFHPAPADEVSLYPQGGLLHDVGKLGVSNRILDKPGALTPEEFQQITLHPLYSWEILSHVRAFSHLAAPASRHHERLDGKGYPWGLGGSDLDLSTRIITVADVVEAITANRPYPEPMSNERVLRLLEREAGPSLDPDVVTTMIQLLKERGSEPAVGLAGEN